MKTITIRDLRQSWPDAEAALMVEDEILITRDSKPVAKLVRYIHPETRRRRWNPEEHRKWIKKVYGNSDMANSRHSDDVESLRIIACLGVRVGRHFAAKNAAGEQGPSAGSNRHGQIGAGPNAIAIAFGSREIELQNAAADEFE